MRSHYWTCSKFADWLRGTPKPHAETSAGWDKWYALAKAAYPVRYWLAEEGLDYAQKIVFWIPDKLYDIKYYINNRWVTHTHALTAHPRDIPRGEWRDVGNRFLPCLFNELQDFVEVELAWHHIAWANKEDTAKYTPPFWAKGWWRVRTWRCAEAGLDSLEWQRRLTKGQDGWNKGEEDADEPTPQAIAAQEILDLYNWWTQIYPNRPDVHDASGWTQVCRDMEAENGGKWSLGAPKSKELQKRSDRAHKLMRKMEADFEKEDEQMMVRLIKIRRSLWT